MVRLCNDRHGALVACELSAWLSLAGSAMWEICSSSVDADGGSDHETAQRRLTAQFVAMTLC